MRISNFGMGIFCEVISLLAQVYMLKSNIDVFFVKSFLCSLKFLFILRGVYKKKIIISMAQFLWYDCTFKK